MARRSPLPLRFLLAMALGACAVACSGGADDGNTGSTQAAVTDDTADDALAPKVTLSAFDRDTGLLTGTSCDQPFSATVTPSTRVRRAMLNTYPTGPVKDLAEQWDALSAAYPTGPVDIGQFGGPGGQYLDLLEKFAALGANFRVELNADGTAKSLRPVR